jgi:hypothetical protein
MAAKIEFYSRSLCLYVILFALQILNNIWLLQNLKMTSKFKMTAETTFAIKISVILNFKEKNPKKIYKAYIILKKRERKINLKVLNGKHWQH